MLEPFLTLQEAGFSQKRGKGTPDRHYWSPELVASLDWLRVAELARAIAARAGCELAGSRVGMNGSVLFAMLEEPRSPSPQRALVKLVAWNEWGAMPEHVEAFAAELRTAKDARGILIAPGGFTSAAMQRAAELRIEAVDAVSLCQVLTDMPAEQSAGRRAAPFASERWRGRREPKRCRPWRVFLMRAVWWRTRFSAISWR